MPPSAAVTADGPEIRRLRTQAGLTLVQLATEAGCTPQTLSNIERGNKRCSRALLARIALALGATEEDLVRSYDEDGALLSIERAAVELDCSPMHVRRLVEDGVLRATDIARPGSRPKMRVHRDELAGFIKGRTVRYRASA